MSGIQQMRASQSDTLNKNGVAPILNGDSFTKVTDSSSEGDNSVNDTGDKINHFQVKEVRFTPAVLEFVDAFPGKQFLKKFTIQNIGRNPVVIRIGEPTSFIFLLKKSSRRSIFLASGASITRTVTYTYHSDDLVQKSRIPIYINSRQIDFPIVVKKATPQLEVDPPQIDFGTINLGSEVKALILTIYNVGGARTKFEIDVGKNDLDLVVNPLKGTVKAKEHVKVTVELMGMKEGVFYKEIWIKTNELPIRVPVLVEVVRPRLLIIYPNGTEELSAIDFPPTFVGTQKAVPFVIKNRGAETALFITVGEVNGEYQFLDEARKNHHTFNLFNLTAEEGRLEPHECRVLTALFRPQTVKKTKGWHHLKQVEKKPQMEHVVFFTMSRVHCIERKEIEKACAPYYQGENRKTLSPKVKTESSNLIEPAEAAGEETVTEGYSVKEGGFRLCLRGKSVNPEILLQPTELNFGEVCFGRTEQKVLTITNESIIRVKCAILKKMNVKVTPEQIWIEPGKIHEFSVRVKPTCAGTFHHIVKIQIFGESDVVYEADKPLLIIAEYSVKVFFKSFNPEKVLEPKICPGLTPLITNEVGINKELATFSNADKVPFAAKLLALNEEYKPIWMRMKSAELDNAIIALPNDRPRVFQTWPKKKICRTIFKGWLRYAPPKDTLYTLSSQEQIAKTQNYEMWTNYLLVMRELREAYNEKPTECKDVLASCYTKTFSKYLKSEECQKFKMAAMKIKRKAVGFNLQNCLVPLSPMYLSYVAVEPKMINFGLVAVNNAISANLKINNHNVFPIAIMFIPGNSAVTVNEGSAIVHPSSEKTIKVWFELGILGRYYGFLNYVINGSHEFKITISAFVIGRTLFIEPKSLTFSNYPLTKAFQPKSLFLSMENWVQASISYKMEFSADSPYFCVPEEGVVPPKSKLLSEVVTALHPKKPLAAELKVVSESGEKELLKISQMSRKIMVKFQTSRIDLKKIPLNLKTKVTAIIENALPHKSAKLISFAEHGEIGCNRAHSSLLRIYQNGSTWHSDLRGLCICQRIKSNMNNDISIISSLDNEGSDSNVPLSMAIVVLSNECFHDVTFEVIDGSPMPGVTIDPKLGVIRARSFFPLNIEIQIPVAMHFSFDIHTIVQISNEISVKVTGNVVLPDIRIKPSLINMRKICSQSFDTVKICVENAGTTPSEVDIDFKACPECTVIKGNSHLYLNPKQATSVVIMFEPKDAARFVFYVPIVINNILGPPMMQEIETENVYFFLSNLEKTYDFYGEVRDTEKSGEKIPLATLSCTVASNLITVTPKSIVFLQRQMMKSLIKASSDALCKFNVNDYLFPTKTLVISNDGTKDVTFCLRNDDLGKSNESPFDLEPVDPESVEYRLKSMKATLKPGSQLVFRAKFSPKKHGKYSVQVPVYVRGYNDGVVYCYITLSGELNGPNLIPEAEEIHFYPVPLNVSSELTFTVTAENYYKTDTISCLICESKEKETVNAHCLTTKWLETPEVSELNGRQKLGIRISFKSSTPVALRCYLVFIDSSENYCSVLLTAVADNSSVTLYSLLNFNTSKYKIVRRDCTPQIWKADEHPVLSYPFEKGHLYKSDKTEWKSYDIESNLFPNQYIQETDKAPSLVVQGALSTLNVGLVVRRKSSEESMTALSHANNIDFKAMSLLSAVKSMHSKANINKVDVSFPLYPSHENSYKKYCDKTLMYVERWMYEVVMRCDQYFMIPSSFMIFKNHLDRETKMKSRKQKDIIHFLSEIYQEDPVQRLEDINECGCPILRATRLFGFYNTILQMLESRGCFLPHVRAEYLLPYDDYRLYVQNVNSSDILRPKFGELRTNMSAKLSPSTLHQKLKSEADDSQFLKTNSNISNKEWFSTKSVFETLSSPLEADSEKEGNGDETDKGTMESHSKNVEINPDIDVEFEYSYELIEEAEFNRRSRQAWLDIVIQIFRHSVLKKIVYKSTIPEVQVIEPNEKIPVEKMETSNVSLYGGGKGMMTDMCTSNLYNVQERMLLLWLNHHLNVQRKQIWRNVNSDKQIPTNKFINNFHKDLSDSLALISVTASYCPYVIPEYFRDCIPEPDTPSKIYHNAARLVQAWRELNIGLTVETVDIVQPNNIFMVMLVAQLYEVLPALHPRYLVCLEASLSSHQSKKFSVQTDLEKLVIQPKLLGEDSKYFVLNQTSLLEIKKGRVQDIKVTFFARKIKRMKATLLLSGCEESPYFGKGLAFLIEGQLTELDESRKMNFSAPLYKVICTEIPIKPPYPESATYELWYTTVKPLLSESSELMGVCKPWSKISYRKVCRRLFLNKSEVSFDPEEKTISLSVTVACFTRKDRLFWLLFRSKTGDFIVRIKIKPKTEKKPPITANCWYPDTWPTCLCPKTEKEPRINWSEIKSCPLITVIRLPSRNVDLWNALKSMFLKCVLPQEKTFWTQYFEKDIGLCIIRWLLNPDEEEEVIDEFVPLLQTSITYNLTVMDSKKFLKMPPQIEIKDVRQEEDFMIPVHIAEGAKNQMEVEMKSESEMEVRRFIVQVNSLKQTDEEEESEDELVLNDTCQPCINPCLSNTPSNNFRKSKKFAKLY